MRLPTFIDVYELMVYDITIHFCLVKTVFGPAITIHSDPICPDRTPTEVCPTLAATVSTDGNLLG